MSAGRPVNGHGAGPFLYGVLCRGDSVREVGSCGLVELTAAEYERQLLRPDRLWFCPRCGSTADWDDDSLCTSGDAD